MKRENDNDYPWFKYYKNMKTHIDYPDVSMYEMVKRTAKKYPSNIAYKYYGSEVTYRSLLRRIDDSACAFARIGVKKGDVVSICMPNTPEAIISVYALNKLGAVCNMLHPLSSEEELKNEINFAESAYLIVADIAFSKIKNIKKDISVKKILYFPVCESMDPMSKIGYKLTEGRKASVPIGEDVIPYYRFIALSRFYRDDIKDDGVGSDVAVILYSGGTTGSPKGVLLTNMNFNSLALSGVEINKALGSGVSILAIMPIFHGFGLASNFHVAFVSGSTAIILPSVNPRKFDNILLKYKPNMIACVPSLLESITNSKKLKDEDLSFLKCVVCGGDALSPVLNKKIDKFLFDHGSDAFVRTAYGMSECSAGVSMMPREETRENSIGIPFPDCYIKICKPGSIDECNYGEVGEICINGPIVMMGYLNNKKETEMALKKHKDGKIWLHSGDVGCMDKDGFIYFKSRIKRMIVSSGYNIYPGQLEAIICEHPYVKACAVVGVPHPYKKEVAKAYIVLKCGVVLNSEIKKSIREYCEKNIASYALPYAYGYRKELPKTNLGKVAYRELTLGDDGE